MSGNFRKLINVTRTSSAVAANRVTLYSYVIYFKMLFNNAELYTFAINLSPVITVCLFCIISEI